MSTELMTEKQLRLLLENKYKCKCDGKELPPPYVDPDEMPTWYISPTGHHFSVSPPPDGLSYKAWMVEGIIQAGKLEVVVSMEKKPDKIESDN